MVFYKHANTKDFSIGMLFATYSDRRPEEVRTLGSPFKKTKHVGGVTDAV
jgi:hypothetical protein